jgi:uncharacterized protein
VVIAGDKANDAELQAVATASFAFAKTVLRFHAGQVVAANLPPVLAETIPNLPALKSGKSFAVVCSGSTCQPPVFDPSELRVALESR